MVDVSTIPYRDYLGRDGSALTAPLSCGAFIRNVDIDGRVIHVRRPGQVLDPVNAPT